MDNTIIIRLERREERRIVENVVRESFWNVYRPGCAEHCVLNRLRNDKDFIEELNFVIERDGRIIGQSVSVRATITLDDGESLPIITMGPICILPEFKRQGLGKKLLDFSLQKAVSLGYGAVCFEGNINFYTKSGFNYASHYGIRYHGLSKGEDASFFLCKELLPGYLNGISGEYSTPQVYYVSDEEVEEFDKSFPHKEKFKLCGQIF